MDIYWQSSNWQNNNFTSRQAITFMVAAFLVALFLLIPITYQKKASQQVSLIAIELIKPALIQVKQEKIIEPVVIPTEVKQSEPIAKPIAKPIVKPKQVVKPKPVVKNITPRVVSVTPKQDKSKLPSAGMILNSIQNRNTLQTVSKDFQLANENDDDFIYKEVPKEQSQLLITEHGVIPQVVTDSKDSFALGKVKGLMNFLFAPIKDNEKTQDSLSYCPSLGRRSTFCPTSNPFAN